ncbi:MAG: cation:proton antiporter [Candidatus Firestonebacteria bacterium]
MTADVVPLIMGLLIFISSFISLKVGLSVAIIEVLLGVIAGAFGLKAEPWMIYIGSFGGIVLTFLAGTEIDIDSIKEKLKESFLIGIFSFFISFSGIFLYVYYIANWSYNASLIAGLAVSSTSIAVVYSVLVETKMLKPEIGKILMSATFITNVIGALGLSVLFVKPTMYSFIFIMISIIVIFFASKYSHIIFHNPVLRNKVIEPEIKYIFLILLVFVFFAELSGMYAILPAFILGLFMSKYFSKKSETIILMNRLRTVAYAFITPIFFISGGLKVSLPLLLSCIGIFIILFILKLTTKFTGVFFLSKKYIGVESMYFTLLMSTGLTFDLIVSLFGLNSGFINQSQYSLLVGVAIASAIIPTFIAQKWFFPGAEEDLLI